MTFATTVHDDHDLHHSLLHHCKAQCERDCLVTEFCLRSFEFSCNIHPEYNSHFSSTLKHKLNKALELDAQDDKSIAGICVYPAYIQDVKETAGNHIRAIAAINIPGQEMTKEKLPRAIYSSVQNGADEIEYFMSGRPDLLSHELYNIAQARNICAFAGLAHKRKIPLRICVNAASLTDFKKFKDTVTHPAVLDCDFITLDMRAHNFSDMQESLKYEAIAAICDSIFDHAACYPPSEADRAIKNARLGTENMPRIAKIPGLALRMSKPSFEQLKVYTMLTSDLLGNRYLSPESFRISSGDEVFNDLWKRLRNPPIAPVALIPSGD